MATFLRAALALLGATALASAASDTTPVGKVITLLEDLKTEVEDEGKAEAGTYDKFACFCKEKTAGKSQSITAGNDNIHSLSADIEAKTAESESKANELKKRQQEQEANKAELQETTLRCAKAQAEYEATAADLSKAISSLQRAIQAMTASKPSLLAINQVKHTLELATAMGMLEEAKRQAVSVLLQVDPADPEYKYHSQNIIDTLDKLLSDFTAEKSDLDTEWGKTKKACDDTKSSLETKIAENDKAMNTLTGEIQTLTGEIASARESLVGAESQLKDDQQYLQDLTQRCETSARDWDQRSKARADELEALTGALAILTNNVSSLDTQVNKRAMLQLVRNGTAPNEVTDHKSPDHKTPDHKSPDHKSPDHRSPDHRNPDHKQEEPTQRLANVSLHGAAGLSFLQQGSHAQLRGALVVAATSSQEKDRLDRVAAMLRGEGSRLDSAALALLAAHVASDPFGKVKQLIQQLIERLLSESTAEASKKGFCDQELGKANQDRDYRLSDAKKLDAELKELELKKEELTIAIAQLTEAIAALQEDLAKATALRETEHKENVEVIAKAKDGAVAVKQAISILKLYYTKAARAKVLLQASPVDEDTKGAGFSGAYQGKLTSSKGILGLLEVIQSDFERTTKMTDAAEKKAAEEFVEFDRASRADISGKETQKTLDEEDLTTTINTIASKMADLQTAQDLLDSALKTVEALKPTCIDTGMSYSERVAKREEEITALKKALCILDPAGVEPDCK